MKKIIITFCLLLFSFFCLANNPFQDRLSILNREIILFQIKIKSSGRFDYLVWGEEFLNLKEKIFLLKQDTQKDYLRNRTYSSEFSELMGLVTDLAQLKLEVLSTYKKTDSIFYLERYNDLNNSYTNFYEKILLTKW